MLYDSPEYISALISDDLEIIIATHGQKYVARILGCSQAAISQRGADSSKYSFLEITKLADKHARLRRLVHRYYGRGERTEFVPVESLGFNNLERCAQLMQQLGGALRDGTIDEKEARELVEQSNLTINDLESLIHGLRGVVE